MIIINDIGGELPILIIALFSARMIASPTISYPNEEENEQVDNNNNNKETAYFFQTCLGNQPNNKNPYFLFL